MTVTVPKIRNAAAMDVDISVWFHIKVFALLFFFGHNSVISFSVMCFVCQQNVRETGKFSS